MRLVWCALVVGALGTATPPAWAQQQPRIEGVHLRFGGGVARSSLGVAGTTGTGVGVVLVVEAAGVQGPWRTWAAELQVEPVAVPNLVRSEHYRAFTVLISRYFFGPLGIGIGAQGRFWGGFDPYVASDWGPALGLTLTTPTAALGDWLLSSDLAWRISGGDEIDTGVIGLRVLLGRRRGGGGRN